MNHPVASTEPAQDGVNRRALIGQFGRTAAAVIAVGAAATAGVTLSSLPGDCREIGGMKVSWIVSRLFSDRGWMRGLDVEAGEDRG